MDAWEILGIRPGATDDDIRAAYLEQVKRNPPESAPERFERIRDAYQMLRDPRARARQVLAGPDPVRPLPELLDELPEINRHAGLAAWMAVIEEKPLDKVR